MTMTTEAPQIAPQSAPQAPVAPAQAQPAAEVQVLTAANESFFPNGRMMYAPAGQGSSQPVPSVTATAQEGGHPGEPPDGTQASQPGLIGSPQISANNFSPSSTPEPSQPQNQPPVPSPSPVYHASGALGRTLELDPGVGERTLGALREYEGTIRRFQSEKDRLEAQVRQISAQPAQPAVDMEALAAFALESGLDQAAFQRLTGILKANPQSAAQNGSGIPPNAPVAALPPEDRALLSEIREQRRAETMVTEAAGIAQSQIAVFERLAPGSMAGIDPRQVGELILHAGREAHRLGRAHEFPTERLFEMAVETIRGQRQSNQPAPVQAPAPPTVQRAPIPVSSGGGVPPGMVSPQRVNGQAPGAVPARVVNSGSPGGAAPGTAAYYAEKARANGIQMPSWVG